MSKESNAAEVPGIMLAASQHLTKMASQNVELVKRAESAERENLIAKIARRMEVRGLQQHLSYEEKVAQLNLVEDLNTMQQAVELAAGGVSIGKVAESEPTAHQPSSAEDLDAFINSQAAFA